MSGETNETKKQGRPASPDSLRGLIEQARTAANKLLHVAPSEMKADILKIRECLGAARKKVR